MGRKGGKIGGPRRFAMLSPAERRAFAVRNACLSMAQRVVTIWSLQVKAADCAQRYSIVGASVNAPKQFRQMRKHLPFPVEFEELHLRKAVFSDFPGEVEKLTDMRDRVEWEGVPPIVLTLMGSLPRRGYRKGRESPDALAEWLKPVRRGRPPKAKH